MPDVDPAVVAVQLRAALAAIDSGDVEATAVERAFLAGGLDVAERLAGMPD